jgi:hypothetical protein
MGIKANRLIPEANRLATEGLMIFGGSNAISLLESVNSIITTPWKDFKTGSDIKFVDLTS